MSEPNERRLITRKQFREMQGNPSEMSIWRRERKVAGYPQPVFINGRAHYWADEVEAYLATLPTASKLTPPVRGAA